MNFPSRRERSSLSSSKSPPFIAQGQSATGYHSKAAAGKSLPGSGCGNEHFFRGTRLPLLAGYEVAALKLIEKQNGVPLIQSCVRAQGRCLSKLPLCTSSRSSPSEHRLYCNNAADLSEVVNPNSDSALFRQQQCSHHNCLGSGERNLKDAAQLSDSQLVQQHGSHAMGPECSWVGIGRCGRRVGRLLHYAQLLPKPIQVVQLICSLRSVSPR